MENITTNLYLSAKKWKENNPEKYKQIRKNWKLKNKDKIKEHNKSYRLKHPDKMREFEKRKAETVQGNINKKYYRYKYSAKKRKHSFNLTKEHFATLISGSCVYCGTVQGKIGIDRVVNSIGYEPDNVVSCCWPCNSLKRTMSKERYINLCIAVANLQRKI